MSNCGITHPHGAHVVRDTTAPASVVRNLQLCPGVLAQPYVSLFRPGQSPSVSYR